MTRRILLKIFKLWIIYKKACRDCLKKIYIDRNVNFIIYFLPCLNLLICNKTLRQKPYFKIFLHAFHNII